MFLSKLYGTVDFLANCGGLLGLFVGVSVLSIVEVFYYFILRLACIMRKPPEVDYGVKSHTTNIASTIIERY